jgi:hypothetical protein
MAIATLTFDLTDIDDRLEHFKCVKSAAMASFIHELVYNAKKSIKYSIEAKQIKDEAFDVYDAVELVFERIHYLLDEEKIDISELIV